MFDRPLHTRNGWHGRGRRADRTGVSSIASVFLTLYISLMSRSATLPPIRVAPETKARLEAVLREGLA